MAKDDLIDGHVSAKQAKRAVGALLDHALQHKAKREETELLPGKEQHVWLQVAVKKMQPERRLKPFKIPIKHPLVDPRTTAVCLITKDPQREYKDLLMENGIKFINRVVGITKLKGKFKPFEARRLLLQENGMFLADERVVPLLPALLGKKFFDAKKQPIPVSLTRKDIKGELERAISSTYMHQNQGTCTSIKIGILSQTAQQIQANLKTALPSIIKAVKGEWDNIQSLSIKTNSSASLPIWSCHLGAEEGGRWDGMVVDDEAESDGDESGEESESAEDEMDVKVEVPEQVKKRGVKESEEAPKGKKRAAEEEVHTPQKKAKATAEVPSKAAPGPAAPAPAKTPSVDPTAPQTAEPAKKRRKAAADKTAPAPPTETLPTSSVPDPSITIPAEKSEKKSKRKSAAAPAAPVLGAVASGSKADVESADPSLVAPAVAETEKRHRRKKHAGNDTADAPAAILPAEPTPAPVVAESSTTEPPSKNSKKKKAKAEAAAAASASTAEAPPAEAAAPRKSAKAKAADVVPVPDAVTTSIAAASKKARKAKKAEATTEAAVAPPVAVPAAPAVVEAVGTESDAPKKRKPRVRRSKAAEGEPATPAADTETDTGLSKDELKQKRAVAVVGEKKKEKVVKGKKGTAKEDILGKKL